MANWTVEMQNLHAGGGIDSLTGITADWAMQNSRVQEEAFYSVYPLSPFQPSPLAHRSDSPFELFRAISPFSPSQVKLDHELIFEDSIQRAASSPDSLDGVLRAMQYHQLPVGSLEQQLAVAFTPPQQLEHALSTSSWANDHVSKAHHQSVNELHMEMNTGNKFQQLSNLQHPGVVPHHELSQQHVSWMVVPDTTDAEWLGENWHTSNSGAQNAIQQQQQPKCKVEEGLLHTTESGMMMPEQNSSMDATGLQLVHLLVACAEAVANEQISLAHVIFVRLSSLVAPGGNTMQRLAAIFVDALAARVMGTTNSGPYRGLAGDRSVPMSDMLEAYSVLYESTPLGKFAHLTCNQILLDAVEGENSIHVLDLDIWHGMQWPAFLQALALRPGGPPRVRMTAIGASFHDLEVAREKLQEYAAKLRVPFEFCPIVERLVNFQVGMVQLREGEVLVINTFIQLHRLLIKGNEKFHGFLCDLQSLKPRVVALAENDGDHNSPAFLHRFVECLRYYSAIFDAFDASLPHDKPALFKIEKIFSGQKIRNIIACEGSARVERHETMLQWSQRMEAAGFRGVGISTHAFNQARLLLNLYYHNGFTLSSQHGYLVAGWYNMGLMGASAWC